MPFFYFLKKIVFKKKEISNLPCIYKVGGKYMKLKKFLVFVFVIIFVFILQVSASTRNDTFSSEFIKEYGFVDTTGHYGNFQHFTRDSDGATSYCIEPGVSLSSGIYEGFYDLSLEEKASRVGLSKEQLERVSLIAHFGWGYQGHFGNDWLVATQTMIWKETGRTLYFTSRYHPSDPWKYVIDTPSEIVLHMEEIERNIEAYKNGLSFSSTYAKIPVGDSYDFVDFNNRLGDYKIECNNCIYSVLGNVLHVLPTSNNNGSVILSKQSLEWGGDFVVYYSGNGQNVLVPGIVSSVRHELSFDVVSGSVHLNKFDLDSKSCHSKEGGSLEGSVYYLYKEDGTFVKELVIDENCSASVTDLELGSYSIREEKAGLNYELDTNSYAFVLSLEHPNENLVLYDKMFLGQVKLEKIDNKTKICKPFSPYATLSGAIYGLYKKDGTLLEKLTIDENCSAISKRNLLLGEYYIRELKAPKGYTLDKNKYYFTVSKENADGVLPIVLEEKIYETNVVLYKTYASSFWGLHAEEDAEFIIYRKKDNKKIATLVTNDKGYAEIKLPYGEYILKQVIGKTGYYLQEDIFFTIEEEMSRSSLENTKQIHLVNLPYQGRLEFLKLDAATGKTLQDAYIEIYSDNGILVFQGKTDENGKLVVDNLDYGKYYLIEKEAPKGYALSLERMYFEICEEGQVVSLSLLNEQEVHVPNTGIFFSPRYLLFSFFCFIGGIVSILYGKKKV